MNDSRWRRGGTVLATMLAAGSVGAVEINSSLAPLTLSLPRNLLAATSLFLNDPVDGIAAPNDSAWLMAAVTESVAYSKKASTCSEVIGPNTNYDPGTYSRRNSIQPELDAINAILPMTIDKQSGNPTSAYMQKYASLLKGVQVMVIRPPSHGKLLPIQVEGTSGYFFMADQGYFGRDQIVFKVKFGNGQTVLLKNDVSIVDLPSEYSHRAECLTTPAQYEEMRQEDFDVIKRRWERMRESNREDESIDPFAYFFIDQGVGRAFSANTSWQTEGRVADLELRVADIQATAVAQTDGATITLDTNAAGHGWYIDYTPYLNEEYLPTANPNEWVAKADSEAAGKMDMLSVLLHEYGHALGIDHSASAHDYMATTLAPGVRRLPSADELALMAKLAGELRLELAGDSTPSPDAPKEVPLGDAPSSPLPSVPLGGSLGLALLGRLRGNRYGGWNVAVDSVSPLLPSVPQYAVAANPKLSNTEFVGGQGWSTAGDVRFQDGAATLSESAVSQTRLNQVFIVGENDRFLSFTVADTALDDADQAPDDAFEVALLDANSGASLLGDTGLTRNDAFLNLQADGNEHKSQAVTTIRNADGSRTYLVDLAGIPAGTAVNLAFDLIGFGKGAAAASSHLTIRDLRIGVPQAKDDSATLAEDSTIAIAALANDRGLQMSAQQPGFVPVIVDAPAHGQVTINADGTFSFTPDQDWNGDDHFTYAPKEVPLGTSSATVMSIPISPPSA